MKKLVLFLLLAIICLPAVSGAKDMTITGVFESGTRYAPATFGYEEDQYAFDPDAIGSQWQKRLEEMIDMCEDNPCDLRGNVVPDPDGQYRGIIKSIKSIKINNSAG